VHASIEDVEARYYEKIDGRKVKCRLCPHECVIADGKSGFCGIRTNNGGKLIAGTYGRVAAVHIDPIEKKPLYHFHPGSDILSIGSVGCDLRCDFCQNVELVLGDRPGSYMAPKEVASNAGRYGSIGVAYTYNEPMIWLEYVMDTGNLVRQAGLKNVLVTNGYINPEPLEELLTVTDAMNIDLKSMDNAFYQKLCKGTLEPVLQTIQRAASSCHVEVTNLIVTNQNDSPELITKLVDFVYSVDPKIPLHLSRYFPHHKLSEPPTPTPTLKGAYRIASEKLSHVYVGNAMLEQGNDTKCSQCGAILISRRGYSVDTSGMSDGDCRECGNKADVVV
jgi:pyruvate formate lyase activating enzyme